MPLVSTKQMLNDAHARHYAVCAFNAENMEMVQAIISAAQHLKAPVIIQTTPGTLDYADPTIYAAIVKAAAESATIPVAVHLDHGNSFEMAMKAVKAGYTSIMIDGSKKPFDENVAITKQVMDVCRAMGIPVEAELGQVGGKEDTQLCDKPAYADPYEVAEFVRLTNVDSLAVGIGTAHGIYKGAPKIDVERLSQIHAVVDVPLVLHGTSGVPRVVVQDCIRRGICKVNYATDLRIAYTDGVRKFLESDDKAIDPKKYGQAAKKEVYDCVTDRIRLCGSDGKA